MNLRWGILGVAKINRRLSPAFAKARNAELRAIASRSLERARDAAAATSIPIAHGSYEALLDDPNIDAVYVPLPNHLHTEYTRKAADRGKHILCEKPLAPTAAEARDVVEHCRKKKVCLMDGFMWPHHPRTARIRQLLDEGAIGNVTHVNGTFSFDLEPEPSNIRRQAKMGGGSLLDIGCYPVYAMRWALGAEPEIVQAMATYDRGVDLNMSGILRFTGGRTATFDCSFALPFRTWFEIVGTKGVIRVPHMWVPTPGQSFLEIEKEDKMERISVEGADQIVRMIEEFGNAVLEKREPAPSADEAVKTLNVLDALAEAAKTGREISV